MPELPEVETVRRQLDARLKGKIIVDVQMYKSGRETPSGLAFVSRVMGRRINGVQRRAKVLVFELEDETAILAHLKMTGKFLFVEAHENEGKHDRILFVFNDGTRMIWSDVRQFGYVKIVDKAELAALMSAYGPEPLETSAEALAERLMRPATRKTKAALLDQGTIAGIGNIYADEACFRARIHPTRTLASLTFEDRLRLANEIINVLQESLAQRGTSANDYVDTNGEKGGFLSLLKVYGREKLPCLDCQTPIEKIFLAQRGTHFCPWCQR